jgi:hypothetical protein
VNHLKFKLRTLLMLVMITGSVEAAELALTCTDAANALISGSTAKQSTQGYRSSSDQREIRWTSPAGHQGLCSVDSQGRVFEVRITHFPQSVGETYSINCKSNNKRRKNCPLKGLAQVELDRQISRVKCTRGQTWDVNNTTLWVDKGCDGRFLVTSLPTWKPYTLKCESRNKKRASCPVKADAVVSLQRQTGRNSCQQGVSWGHSGNAIWVDRGCKGIFDIRPWRSEHPDYQTSRERAKAACTKIAKDYKFTVKAVRIIETGQHHFDLEMGATRNRVDIELMCRYQVSDGEARLYSF